MTISISLADPRLQNFSGEVVRAQGLVSQGEYPEAKVVFLALLTETRQLGIVSGDVLWGLAVVSDYLSEFVDAIRYCRLALQSDLLSPSYRRSWSVIGHRIRSALLDSSRSDTDKEIQQLHAAAIEAGVADDDLRLRVARHYLATGRFEHARHFLEAMTTLSPGCSEAWVMLADIALRTGDEALAGRCSLAVGGNSLNPEPWRLQPAAEA